MLNNENNIPPQGNPYELRKAHMAWRIMTALYCSLFLYTCSILHVNILAVRMH